MRQFQPVTEPAPRVAVVVSSYNAWITQALLEGARRAFAASAGSDDELCIAEAAGTFEITALCRALAHSGHYDCLVALGCVIRGETPHFDYICDSVTRGLTDITLATGVPVGYGILTCETRQQAEARAGGEQGNKGEEAMQAALQTVATLRAFPPTVGSQARTAPGMCDQPTDSDNEQEQPGERRPVTSLVAPAEPEQTSTTPPSASARTEADPRLIRQLALLALYQLDARGGEDADSVSEHMPFAGLTLLQRDEEELPRRKGPKKKQHAPISEKGFAEHDLRVAYDLASSAYERREEADALMRELAPDWPPERQPTVDRCILRLAYHEMVTGRTSPKIAINEAVELAKRFSTDRSPLFINGVLDKTMRRLQKDA